MASIVAVPPSPVLFGEKLAASGLFDALFRSGMALVEQTAAYLDGEGREQSRRLNRAAALAYASESMRLTTRLMQIASWLLLQRAVNEGEMSADEAAADKRRTRAAWESVPVPTQDAPVLPTSLLTLIDSSIDLQLRIQRLDSAIGQSIPAGGHNPLETERALLRQAFAG